LISNIRKGGLIIKLRNIAVLFFTAIITTFSLIVNIDINYIIVNKVNTNMFAYALIFYLLFSYIVILFSSNTIELT